MSEVSTNILASVRAETRETHKALETEPYYVALRAGAVTEPQYATRLGLELALLRLLEPRWRGSADLRIRTLARATEDKRPLIEADLRALGVGPAHAVECPWLCETTVAAEVRGAGGLAGALYVIEGSSLGGGRLAPIVARSFRRGLETTHYFRVYASEKGAQWKRFARMLEEMRWSDQETAAGCAAANWVFDVARRFGLIAWLRPGAGKLARLG